MTFVLSSEKGPIGALVVNQARDGGQSCGQNGHGENVKTPRSVFEVAVEEKGEGGVCNKLGADCVSRVLACQSCHCHKVGAFLPILPMRTEAP